MKFLADENFPRPAIGAVERLAGMSSRSRRSAPAYQVRMSPGSVRTNKESSSRSTRISASWFSIAGSRQVAEWFCSASRRIPRRRLRTSPWRCFSLSRILPARFALSHGTGFGFAHLAQVSAADHFVFQRLVGAIWIPFLGFAGDVGDGATAVSVGDALLHVADEPDAETDRTRRSC
jgi:hypothetical protein